MIRLKEADGRLEVSLIMPQEMLLKEVGKDLL
jgi:hypothetical protein